MSAGVLKSPANNTSPSDRLAPRTLPLVWLGLAALLFLAFFGGNLLKLSERWSKDPSYSHGFLVPLISLWLAWRAYRRAGKPVEGDIRIGCMAMLAGAMLHLLLTIINNPILDFVAVGLVLWGLAVAVGGVEWAWGFLFPIGFLFFMFPLPATWTNFAGLLLQDWVARVSAAVLDPFVVCYRRGNSLYLAGVPEPLVVAAECSGLRQIISFVALGVLVGGLSRKSTSFRVLLVAAAIPVAIIANVARILLMAAGSVWFGTQWMGGWMHDAPAMLTLPLGLALFVLVGWGLSRFRFAQPAADAPAETGTEPQGSGGTENQGADAPRSFIQRGLLAGVACLGAALLAEVALAWHVHSAEIPPYPDIAAPFSTLPLKLQTPAQTWQGQDLPNLDAFRAKLPYNVDDLLYRYYVPAGGTAGRPLHLYMVYSRQGDDRKHHPEICIRDASGATEDLAARRQIALDAEGERRVMRFRFRTGASQYTTVYYWHYTLEGPPHRELTALRRLYLQQNRPVPSITMQVSLVADLNELEAVEKGFLVTVDTAMRKHHLPATATIGCHRLPIALIRN